MTPSRMISGDTSEQTRFSNILVVCDGGAGDEATMQLAVEMLADTGAVPAVMGLVAPPAGLKRLAKHAGIDPEDVILRIKAEERNRLERLASDLPNPIVIDVRTGKPFLDIIRQVISEKHDLVIKAAEAWNGAPKSLFTSTDQHLLRKCPAPVWLHMPQTPKPPQTVLAAVDVDFEAASQPDTLSGLNATVIETAAKIAHTSDAVLHIVHAWQAAGEGLVWMWSNMRDPQKEVDAYLQSVFEQSRKNLQDLIDTTDLPDTHLRTHSIKGSPRDVLPDKVTELKVDTLVMGSVARTGIPGFIIGNTAEDILNRVECSVVIVKPPGYISPVKS